MGLEFRAWGFNQKRDGASSHPPLLTALSKGDNNEKIDRNACKTIMASKHQQQKAHVNDKDINDDKGNINDNNKRKKLYRCWKSPTPYTSHSSNETKSKGPGCGQLGFRVSDSGFRFRVRCDVALQQHELCGVDRSSVRWIAVARPARTIQPI